MLDPEIMPLLPSSIQNPASGINAPNTARKPGSGRTTSAHAGRICI
jgi:hypothetical protein